MKPLDPLDLTRRLVNIESITYNEAAVGAYLDTLLQERGFAVERTAVAQPPQSRYSGPRFNLYASCGVQPEVVLSTHMDTVPPFIPSSEDDLFLYGRGACDAKGIIAAMVKAAEQLIATDVSDFGLLFVVGEEAGVVDQYHGHHVELYAGVEAGSDGESDAAQGYEDRYGQVLGDLCGE